MQCVSRISQRTGKSHIGVDVTLCQCCLCDAQSFCGKQNPVRQSEAQLCLCNHSLAWGLQTDTLSSGSHLELFWKTLLCQRCGFIADESLRPACSAVVTSLTICSSWAGIYGRDQDEFGSRRYNFSYGKLTFVIKSQVKERIKSPMFISVGVGVYRNIMYNVNNLQHFPV